MTYFVSSGTLNLNSVSQFFDTVGWMAVRASMPSKTRATYCKDCLSVRVEEENHRDTN